ncbi:MAG: adenine phosphoribosyltransferase [Dehalococcoidia bacterium]|nr:adenine phosphoribosyltransferase [Dehalococcoidia bacterium]
MRLEDKIRDIPDFPQKGIVFKDITPLIGDAQGFRLAVDRLAEACRGKDINSIVVLESRGFLFGAPLAYKLGVGITPVRKQGKLPSETFRMEYALEYGTNVVEIHRDALVPGEKVLIVDDLLATGGTALAAAKLVERLGAKVVGLVFVIELTFLSGREKLAGYDVVSLIQY